MTQGEAHEALEESQADSQASSLTQNTIEISTNFTIGQGAANAAGELRQFIETQLPCADIQLENATLSSEAARPKKPSAARRSWVTRHGVTRA